MSAFALYFETRRPFSSTDSTLFRAVNVFTLPPPFTALPCTVLQNGKQHQACWIMWGAWWASFFQFIKGPHGEQARNERRAMATFIAERMHNPCIQPCLFTRWIDDDIPDTITIIEEGTQIPLARLNDIFQRETRGLFLIDP